MASLIDRLIRASRLDPTLYEEVEADTGSLGQAAFVVVLSTIAGGIGTAGMGNPIKLAAAILAALLSWAIWAYITYIIGTRVMPEHGTSADHGELLRTLGFSSAPGIARIFGIIPILGPVITVAVSVWMLAAMIIAVRQALDYKSTLRAGAVCFIGWLVQLLILMLFIGLMP